jgi:hypothetical protein
MTIFVNPALKEAIEEKAPNVPVKNSALLFVSTLYLKAADSENFKEFFPLHSSINRKIYTSRYYDQMRGLLASLKAIEIKDHGSYQVGKRSMRYRLGRKFSDGVISSNIEAPKLEARANRCYELSSYRAMKSPAQKWIVASFKRTTFSKKAADVLASHPFKTTDARHRAENHAANISAKRVRFVVADSGRIYHSVANLPKVLRSELRIDREKTAEIDISCSQPSLLSSLYSLTKKAHLAERESYLAFVLSGTFYEEIAKLGGKGWTRDEAKTEFFNQIAFGSYFCADSYELLPPFSKRFPILSHRMAAVKSRGNRVLPIRMQSLEAKVVIDGACSECAAKKFKVLPVHDSLICKASEALAVAKIFRRHWDEKTKISARLKISIKGKKDILF